MTSPNILLFAGRPLLLQTFSDPLPFSVKHEALPA